MYWNSKFIRIGRRLALCAALSFMLVGCDDEGPVEPEGPSFSDVQSEVFNTACALSGCHAGGNAAEGMDLSAGVAYDNIVNVPSVQVTDLMRVEPGNAADSYLYIKITGGERIQRFRMPIGGELDDEQITLVRDWINAGAHR